MEHMILRCLHMKQQVDSLKFFPQLRAMVLEQQRHDATAAADAESRHQQLDSWMAELATRIQGLEADMAKVAAALPQLRPAAAGAVAGTAV